MRGSSSTYWDAQIAFWNDPRNQARAAQNRQNQAKSTVVYQQGSRSLARLRDQMMESSATREYPSLILTFFVTHTVNGVFTRDEDRAIYDEMLRLQRLGSNTKTGVPYTEEEIMAIVRKAKRCWQGIVGTRPGSDNIFSHMLDQFESSPEFGGPSGGGGCGDDESGGDQDGDEDEEDGDSLMFGRFFPEKFQKKSGKLPAVQASLEKVARERIPGDLSPSTYPSRHVARDEFPQRQVARERREMSLGIMCLKKTRYAVSGKVDTAYWAGFLGVRATFKSVSDIIPNLLDLLYLRIVICMDTAYVDSMDTPY
ncbi:retrotransposon protein, putative, ty3-gypsy subclass [Tanacetum coccineum]